MAARKSLNLLPGIFQTPANEKFLTATVDQLISEPQLKDLYGYIGRKFAPTYKSGDSYIIEGDKLRQDYQLEPSIVIKNDQKEITFFSSYVDFLNQIKYYGGLTDNQDRLFSSEYYSFDPRISYDKFVNFGQYYWLPNGPTVVDVNSTGIDLEKTYVVARNDYSKEYDFNADSQLYIVTAGNFVPGQTYNIRYLGTTDFTLIGASANEVGVTFVATGVGLGTGTASLFVKNNTLYLARGGTYTFQINQDSQFWIQTELGVDGLLNAATTISTRDVLGVENNGATSGEVVFHVPQRTAQDRYVQMPLVSEVDYATPLKFSDLQNQYLSDFLDNFPQYAGIVGQLSGKKMIFIGQNQGVNLDEGSWTVGGTNTTIPIGYPQGSVIPDELRFGIWEVQLINTDSGDKLINLFHVQNVAQDHKVYIKYGIRYANTEWYKEFDGFFYRLPVLSSLLDTLYIQDGSNSEVYAVLKIVEYNSFEIDVINDIIGDPLQDIPAQKFYTSPNGVEFTSGLKIKFGTDVTPAEYKNGTYYVENVGDSIRLVDVNLLVTPEKYNDEVAVNYPLKRITIDTATTSAIPGGTTITFGGIAIVTNTEIPIGSTAITTLDSINGIIKGQEVIGVGIAEGTTVFDAYANTIFPEYITIKRDAKDLNAWSRNNRWFHINVIKAAAAYNREQLVFDQTLRAQRPIVQFEGDLQLYNHGRIGIQHIDVLDTDITDAFNMLEGQVLPTAFGLPEEEFVSGLRVIFAADTDPLVRDKIYTVELVQYELDANNEPTGDKHIKLVKAPDGDASAWDSTVVRLGKYKGSAWWYDGSNWKESQQKTELQQDPLFDIYDYDHTSETGGTSLGDITKYPRSSFAGTKIFGYVRGTSGTNDPVLGFPLSYRSFQSQGDILFANYFATDTFTYVIDQTFITKNVNTGFLQNIVDREVTKDINTWKTVVEPSKQNQLLSFVSDGTNNYFRLDVTPASQDLYSGTIPYIKVYKNKQYLKSNYWSYDQATNSISLVDTPTAGDVIDVEVFSLSPSTLGQYQIPLNLDLNAQNVDIETLTLGQIRNHLIDLSRNSAALDGEILGPNNLRDIEIKAQGGTILQHSAPIPYAALFLVDKEANLMESIQYAAREYSKFKNKFLELSASLPGINPQDPAASVDLILNKINLNKNPSFPFFYSDMVPYGTLKTEYTITVYDPLITTYEISNIFSTTVLSNQAVLIYLNDEQLVLNRDYVFETDRPGVTINSEKITLNVEDVIKVVEYANTDGSYVPETPSKLGTWPKFVPEITLDETYRTPINVIRGHDGSITPAFNDYRDGFLLELEKRIYNNIKLPVTETYEDIFISFPGKFRKTDYSYQEAWQVISRGFLNWLGNNKLDYSSNTTFLSNDSFTWNYASSVDRLTGEYLQGSWRAIFQYFYDTIYPNTRPWEMLGFTSMPDWWENYYGPAPYTGSNQLLWEDLEAGRIRQGYRSQGQNYTVWDPRKVYAKGKYVEYSNKFYVAAVDNGPLDEFNYDQWYEIEQTDIPWIPAIDTRYARPKLSQIIPVDQNGNLLSPAQAIARATNTLKASSAWAVGQMGPVEFAWKTSSDYPFAMQRAAALLKPASYFGELIDTYRIYYNQTLKQYLTLGGNHYKQTDITFNGDNTSGTVVRGAGYLNWIAEYLRSLGIDPATKITPMLKNYQVNLAYKMSGFTDKKYLEVLAEQSSPTSINASIMVPNENYDILLYKSQPVDKITYSAVIIEKTQAGWSVRGYDLNNPYFTIIPSVTNNNGYKITVLDKSVTVFYDYQKYKLTVPYGYEFRSRQQVTDFLVSYERYLLAQGFTFNDVDDVLAEVRNWKLSIREFLFWSQQGWAEGNIIVLSPIRNSLNSINANSIVDEVTDSQRGSRIVDLNFNIIKNPDYTIRRLPGTFNISLLNTENVIAFAELNLVQYEHVLVFDNVTVFNDVIYKPELGNRQYRLKLIGQKTDNWDGSLSANGFVYNSAKFNSWQAGKDYFKGDLVLYKNQYYVALQNVAANTDFNFAEWKQLSNTEIKTGLLNNFSTVAVAAQNYYDSYSAIKDKTQLEYSHGLIGFRPRQYLSDLGLSQTTQIELYKGYIKQKGTINAIDALTAAQFNTINSNIQFFEEWAIRTGEYGALKSNPYIEITLDEKEYSVNPSLAEFVGPLDAGRGNGLTIFNKSQLYRSTDEYTGNLALSRDEHSNYDSDILTAGYVNIDDVSNTIYDIKDYKELDNDLANIGNGYTIWTAKDFTGNWNVYRVSETDNHATNVSNSLDGFIVWSTQTPHGLTDDDIFLVRGFDLAFNGFYQVYTVLDTKRVLVKYNGDAANLKQLTTLDGFGIFYTLDSLRFQYMEDSRIFGLTKPKHGWKVGEKIWIDDDAPTSFIQGQPYETGNHLWKVYEKTQPWTYNHSLLKSTSEYVPNDGYGTSVKISYNGLLATVGSPFANSIPSYASELSVTEVTTGKVFAFDRGPNNQFVQGTNLYPDAGNAAIQTKEYGHAVDQAINRVAVGAPGSYGNIGFVYTYYRAPGTTTYARPQVLWSGNLNAAGERFGTSISLDQNGTWLYVGAPGNSTVKTDRVYVFGLNTHVSERELIIPINDKNIINLSSAVTVSVNDVITQPSTGAQAFVVNAATTSTSIELSTRTAFVSSSGNIYINGVDAGTIISSITHTSVTNSFTLPSFLNGWSMDVANSAPSLSITNSSRTFIPDLDYSVTNNVVTFKGNIAEDVYVVQQKPYYTLHATLTGPKNSNFGYSMDSSLDGAQLGVGAPNANVWVDGAWVQGAGAVYVYDRVIEAFKTTGERDYITTGTIDLVHRVTIDDVEVNDYSVIGSNTIRFTGSNPPPIGKVVFVETNQFNLLERLIGIDNLEGSLKSIQANAAFGTDLTICSNNCAIYVGAPYFTNQTTYNTGAVWKFHNRGRLYGTNTGYGKNPIFNTGDTIRLDNFEITVANISTPASSTASLDDLIENINTAAVLGVTATKYIDANGDEYLKLDSDKTVAKNRLRILSGSGSVYAVADMAIFAFMQIIINPYGASNEYFGNKVVLAQNAYMLVISSERGTTKIEDTFDDGTTIFDQKSTTFYDKVKGSGSTYIYELYDDPRDEVEHPGRYAFCQQLNTGDLNVGDRFGAAIDIIGSDIIVSAPGDDTKAVDAGSVYIFRNPTMTRGWHLIRYQQAKVDVESVNRIFLYDKLTNTISTNLEFIDPAKGKILGAADQEITYKTEYDPAVYNRGTNSSVYINNDIYWGASQVDQVWWNLSQVRFIDYEQGDLTYRSINWGRLFPGSIIEVCEWVESDVLPSQYVIAGYDGVPKYADDSAYVELVYVDPTTNIIGSKYYFWVVDKTSISGINPSRTLPIASISDYIANPKSQGISYAAIIQNHAIILYNVGGYLSGKNTILHLDYEVIKNTSIIHSEYELLQKGNEYSFIPEKISNKLIDSLAGIDAIGSVVPDPKLSEADRYGVSYRPRQSMFINRLRAMSDLVLYVNSVLLTVSIARQYDLTLMNAGEPEPSAKLGEYDQAVETEVELDYIDVRQLSAGYLVLVKQNTQQSNLWTLYELDRDKNWNLIKVQSYKTSLYWSYVDWWANGYGPNDKLDFVVETLIDARKLRVSEGDEILVRVNTGSTFTGWEVYVVNSKLDLTLVGIENGTIQLSNALGDFSNNNIGLGNQGFDSSRFDESPTIETRYIIQALRDDIFIGELGSKFNELFFAMVNYLFTEQKYVDWIFKTSFASVLHRLRSLEQPANYIKDNITYYEDYINEVKPYRTKIREYLTTYNQTTTYTGDVTDFDLPSYYDPTTQTFRSPTGDNFRVDYAVDEQLWATGYYTPTDRLVNPQYTQWYQNRDKVVGQIIVSNPGAGYTVEPTITVTGGGLGSVPATAAATIDFDPYGTITVLPLSNVANVIVTDIYPTIVAPNLLTVSSALSVDIGDYIYQAISGANAQVTGNSYQIGYISLGAGTITANVGDYVTQPATGANAIIKRSVIDASTLYVDFVDNLFVADNGNVLLNSNVSLNNIDANVYPIEVTSVTNIPISYTDANLFIVGAPAGRLTSITVIDPGLGYYENPVININGSCDSPARAYAVLENKQVRAITTNIKFDRISYGTSVQQWSANTSYTANTIVSYNGVGYKVLANVTSGNTFLATDYAVYTANLFNNANDRIMAYYDPTNSMAAKDLNQLVPGIEYPGVQIQGPSFDVNPGFGGIFEITRFDSVDFGPDRTPILSISDLDTEIYSFYTDELLGTRAEDINVDGGAYVDRYASHAPEELVPGITFDTLDMKIFTGNIDVSGNIITVGYRIFKDMLGNVSFIRISDAYSTTLSRDLYMTDTEIYVNDATALYLPRPEYNDPGVIFVNGERITFYRNYALEVAAWVSGQDYIGGEIISNGGDNYKVTSAFSSTDFGNVLNYKLTLQGEIRAVVGDYITQVGTNANAEVIATLGYPTSTIIVRYNTLPEMFTLGSGNLRINGTLSHPANANVAAYTYPGSNIITVSSTLGLYVGMGANVGFDTTATIAAIWPANANVLMTSANSATLTGDIVSFGDIGQGDVSSTGVVVYPVESLGNVQYLEDINVLSQIRRGTAGTGVATMLSWGTDVVDGSLTEVVPDSALKINVLPISYTINTGPTYGNITFPANTRLYTSNIWLNPGDYITTVTDGTGLSGAATVQALFLKGLGAENAADISTLPPGVLIGEDGNGVNNVLTTETGKAIIR